MVRTALTAAFADLWAATTAIDLYYFLKQQPGAGTTSNLAPEFVGHFQIFLTLVAAGGLYTAVAMVYRHVHQTEAAAAAGGGNHRLSDRLALVLIAAAGLEFFLFLQRAGGTDDVGAQASALGRAAARVLPAASMVTFFLGMMLIILSYIRAGGEGGGGAIAGDGPIQAPVWVMMTKMAFAAAAGLVCLMAIALYAIY